MNKRNGKNAIKYIAKKENISENEVKAEINKAIDIAYVSREEHQKWVELFGDRKPTPEEFIDVIAGSLKR